MPPRRGSTSGSAEHHYRPHPLTAVLAGRIQHIQRRENIIALGNSGTGKTHVALALRLAACQKGFSVAFTTAASLVKQLMEARDERRQSSCSATCRRCGC